VNLQNRNKERRAERQAQAAARTPRSPQEQLKHLDALGLVAAKERAKIALRQRKAYEKAFNASPKELGEAAVAAAKKGKT
jgi:hypothetical protein